MAKAKVALAVKEKPQVPERGAPTFNKNAMLDVYLITDIGVTMLMRADAEAVRKQIEEDKEHSLLDYRFFDDDKKVWAYWVVMGVGGIVEPPKFPDSTEYTLTSLQLYTKAVTYPHILAHAVGLLKDKPQTLWDKMLKPATIIMAIVGIMFVMGLMLLALTG